MHQAVDLREQHVRLRLCRDQRERRHSVRAATIPQRQAGLPEKPVWKDLWSVGLPSTTPQDCLLRAGQELPVLGFPALPQPIQLHHTPPWSRLPARRQWGEPPGRGELVSMHLPTGCLLWEHFLGYGVGSMLVLQSGPLPSLPQAPSCRAWGPTGPSPQESALGRCGTGTGGSPRSPSPWPGSTAR